MSFEQAEISEHSSLHRWLGPATTWWPLYHSHLLVWPVLCKLAADYAATGRTSTSWKFIWRLGTSRSSSKTVRVGSGSHGLNVFIAWHLAAVTAFSSPSLSTVYAGSVTFSDDLMATLLVICQFNTPLQTGGDLVADHAAARRMSTSCRFTWR